jgi:transposase
MMGSFGGALMRRPEALQGVRVIKFRSVLDRYESSELNQCEAAELLGIGERTFRRWQQRYEDAGEAGPLDRRLGRAYDTQGTLRMAALERAA